MSILNLVEIFPLSLYDYITLPNQTVVLYAMGTLKGKTVIRLLVEQRGRITLKRDYDSLSSLHVSLINSGYWEDEDGEIDQEEVERFLYNLDRFAQ